MSKIKELNIFKKNVSLLDARYPVGSIYWTEDGSFDPNEYWGGTWEQIKDRFLMAAGTTYKTVGDIGGAASVKLTTNNIPAHSHTTSSHSHPFYVGVTSSSIGAGSIDSKSLSGTISLPLGAVTVEKKKGSATTSTNTTTQYTVSSGGSARTITVSFGKHGHGFTNPAFSATTTMYSSYNSSTKQYSGANSTASATTTTNSVYTATASLVPISTMPKYEIVMCWKRTA